MRSTLLLVFTCLAFTGLSAQNKTRFEIKSLPSHHPAGSSIYLAGSFNGWNPQDEKYRFSQDAGGNYFFELTLGTGTHEYKLTRGGWDKVECGSNGAGIGNRVIKSAADQSVELEVAGWTDLFPSKPGISTAGKNVRIIDTAFMIPELNRTRRVWIYLPENYESSRQKYPVLYMHDGQNLFDELTSFSGEWGVDEFMDTTRLRQSIVVGIDHGAGKRINEYSPYDMDRFGAGEGKEYAAFLAKTLKPFIDKKYRTRRCRKHTRVAGSSMGGLISLYTILKYPRHFGGAGVFSPAFWVAPSIYDDISSYGKKVKGPIYFYAGKQESASMVTDMLNAFEKMAAVSKAKMTTVIRDEGKHNEPAWRNEFPLFYQWIMQ